MQENSGRELEVKNEVKVVNGKKKEVEPQERKKEKKAHQEGKKKEAEPQEGEEEQKKERRVQQDSTK